MARVDAPVDVLVNNAGWDKVEPFVESQPATWDKVIAINFRAPVQLTHAFLPGMLERGWGRLLFLSSDAARVGSTGEAVYAGCKAGLIGFAKTVARESARKGVTSNAVCPGPSDTPMLREIAGDNPKLVEALQRSIPVGRLAQPSDIAGLVAFLASERAAYLTGQTYSVSGGLTMVSTGRVEDVAGDDQLLDLLGALLEPEAARVAVDARDRRVVGVAVAAVHAQGEVGDPADHVEAVELGDRGLRR